MKIGQKYFCLSLASLLFSSVLLQPKVYAEPKSASQVPFRTIVFAPAQTTLTEKNKLELRQLIEDAKKTGSVDQITVAAWSDMNIPKPNIRLPYFERMNAFNRAMEIQRFFGQMKIPYVERVTMAENDSWFAKQFESSDSELTSVFAKRDATVPLSKEELQVLRREGGPFKAVVIVERFQPTPR